jgi:type I restriction enzyme R subunit
VAVQHRHRRQGAGAPDDERGLKVAGGDRLGKTILFAKNQAHAEFIAERFNANYPHFKGEFARVITFKTEYAQDLIDTSHQGAGAAHRDLGRHARHRHRRARSREPGLLQAGALEDQVLADARPRHAPVPGPVRTGAGQAVLPGLRLLPEPRVLQPGPGSNRRSRLASLGKRLFTTRLQLIGALDQRLRTSAAAAGIKEDRLPYAMPANEGELRRDLAELLHRETAAMSLDNFVVRPRRRIVEQYAKAEAWKTLTPEARSQLAAEVAGLPSEMAAEGEEARRFDLLVLRLQLALLRAEPAFQRLREQVMEIAGCWRKSRDSDGSRADGADPGGADRRLVAGRHRRHARRRCAASCASSWR